LPPEPLFLALICTPQTPLGGAYSAPPDPLAVLWRGVGTPGKGEKGRREEKGRGEVMLHF